MSFNLVCRPRSPVKKVARLRPEDLGRVAFDPHSAHRVPEFSGEDALIDLDYLPKGGLDHRPRVTYSRTALRDEFRSTATSSDALPDFHDQDAMLGEKYEEFQEYDGRSNDGGQCNYAEYGDDRTYRRQPDHWPENQYVAGTVHSLRRPPLDSECYKQKVERTTVFGNTDPRRSYNNVPYTYADTSRTYSCVPYKYPDSSRSYGSVPYTYPNSSRSYNVVPHSYQDAPVGKQRKNRSSRFKRGPVTPIFAMSRVGHMPGLVKHEVTGGRWNGS